MMSLFKKLYKEFFGLTEQAETEQSLLGFSSTITN